MRIEHIAIYGNNLEGAKEFFATYLEAKNYYHLKIAFISKQFILPYIK